MYVLRIMSCHVQLSRHAIGVYQQDTKNKDESKGLTANEKNAMTKAAYELLMAVFSDATVFEYVYHSVMCV